MNDRLRSLIQNVSTGASNLLTPPAPGELPPVKPFPVRRWSVLLGTSLLGTIAIWLHAFLTYKWMPPFEHWADHILWGTVWASKLILVFSIPFFCVPRLYHHLGGSGSRVLIAVLSCAIGWILITVLLDIYRLELGAMFNDGASRYYPVAMASPKPTAFGGQLATFILERNSGIVLLRELLLPLIVLSVLLVPAYVRFHPRVVSGLVIFFAWSLSWLTFVGLAICWNFVVVDYDFFYSSTVLGPAAVDSMAFLMPGDSHTEFGLLLRTSFIITAFLLDLYWTRVGPAHDARTSPQETGGPPVPIPPMLPEQQRS